MIRFFYELDIKNLTDEELNAAKEVAEMKHKEILKELAIRIIIAKRNIEMKKFMVEGYI